MGAFKCRLAAAGVFPGCIYLSWDYRGPGSRAGGAVSFWLRESGTAEWEHLGAEAGPQTGVYFEGLDAGREYDVGVKFGTGEWDSPLQYTTARSPGEPQVAPSPPRGAESGKPQGDN